MLLERHKIYIARHLLPVCLLPHLLLLLLLLRVGSHLLAEGKVRDFQASQGSDTNKQNQKERDDSSEAHEQAWREVLVPLKQAALVASRVGALVVCGGVTLELHLDVVAKRVLHFVLVLLLGLKLCLGLRVGGRGGSIDNGVVLQFRVLGQAVFKELICAC